MFGLVILWTVVCGKKANSLEHPRIASESFIALGPSCVKQLKLPGLCVTESRPLSSDSGLCLVKGVAVTVHAFWGLNPGPCAHAYMVYYGAAPPGPGGRCCVL